FCSHPRRTGCVSCRVKQNYPAADAAGSPLSARGLSFLEPKSTKSNRGGAAARPASVMSRNRIRHGVPILLRARSALGGCAGGIPVSPLLGLAGSCSGVRIQLAGRRSVPEDGGRPFHLLAMGSSHP